MKKVGIITLNGYFNYGNRLQNYALQETLKKYFKEVETILIKQNEMKKSNVEKPKIINVISNPKVIFRKIYNIAVLNKKNRQRENRFKDFSEKYINESSYFLTKNKMPIEKVNEFDYFVTGSDQVWNPYFTSGSPLYFLNFASNNKRVSYAASFGISDIPSQYQKQYSKLLNEMSSISVREDAGANIVTKLTGKNSEIVPDPTFLLSKEEWLSLVKPAKNKPKNSILLTYFLGGIPHNVQKLINNYKKKYNMTVVNLADIKKLEYYLTDPSEFLDYINTAELFITDSFHGSIFSILFETPFIVADRKSKLPTMNSRIKTLLSTYRLEHRYIDNITDVDVMNVDFSHINKILDSERARAFSFLERAFDLKK